MYKLNFVEILHFFGLIQMMDIIQYLSWGTCVFQEIAYICNPKNQFRE